MRRFLQRQGPWLIICVLLLGCVLLGLATRASFTDVAQDPNLGKAVYWYNSDITPQTLEDSAQNLMEQSKLIAVVRYQGEQDYTNQNLICSVRNFDIPYQGGSGFCLPGRCFSGGRSHLNL